MNTTKKHNQQINNRHSNQNNTEEHILRRDTCALKKSDIRDTTGINAKQINNGSAIRPTHQGIKMLCTRNADAFRSQDCLTDVHIK